MDYRAEARYLERSYYGNVVGTDAAAVDSAVSQLSASANPAHVALIVRRVYRGNSEQDIAYVTTLSRYLIATE